MDKDLRDLTALMALLTKVVVEMARAQDINHPAISIVDELAKNLYERASSKPARTHQTAVATTTPGFYDPKLDHGAGIVGASGNTTKSTVPSLAELNAPDFPPGSDPLPSQTDLI